MSNARLEVLAWVLIFGGALLASLGLFLQRQGGRFGALIVAAGALAAAAGIFLIWLRSRRQP